MWYWWECKIVELLKKSLAVSLKAKRRITIKLNNSSPDIYPKELKTGTQANTFILIVIAALFTVAKCGKKPSIRQEMMDKQNVVHTYN